MRRAVVGCLVALTAALVTASPARASFPPEVTWTMVDVSVGPPADAHLIDAWGGKTILIDTGTYEGAVERLIPLLQDRGITHLDYVLITHAHRDHYGGLRALVESDVAFDRVFFTLPEREVCDSEIPWGCDWDEVAGVVRLLKRHEVTVRPARPGARSTLGPGVLEVLYSYRGVDTPVGMTDVNDTSVIARLDVGDFSVLFTGDLNEPLGQWLAGEDLGMRRTVLLKVPHHGVEATAPNTFFDHVDPEYAFVPAPRDLWCGDLLAERVRAWLEHHDTIVFVNGLAGHVTVDVGLSHLDVRAERDDVTCETERKDPEEEREVGQQEEREAERQEDQKEEREAEGDDDRDEEREDEEAGERALDSPGAPES